MRRARSRIGGALVVLLLAAGSVPVVFATRAAADNADAEWQFVAGINELRAEAGLAPVTIDVRLTAVARQWSATMVNANRLFHNMALPRWVNGWTKLGENVGVGGSVDQIAAAFAASPPHLEHIIDPAYSLVGVGVIEANGLLWVTEEFERPAPNRTPRPQRTASQVRAIRWPAPVSAGWTR